VLDRSNSVRIFIPSIQRRRRRCSSRRSFNVRCGSVQPASSVSSVRRQRPIRRRRLQRSAAFASCRQTQTRV